MNLKEIALKANGKSQACSKCKMQRKCNIEIAEICRDAFVEGFQKGYKRNKKEEEQKISSILHDASDSVNGKHILIFFRDVRGDEDAAFIERTRFVKFKKGQCIGTVKWKPRESGDPQLLPIAWVNEDDLLNLLGYNKRFKELEAISLNEGSFAYPRKEYEANLEKYKDIRAQFSKHK